MGREGADPKLFHVKHFSEGASGTGRMGSYPQYEHNSQAVEKWLWKT
jgi:hypothetical protein